MQISGPNSSTFINSAQSGIAKASERISSGNRLNRASDDAAGFAISNKFTAQIRGFSQSIRNANDGISMLQTAGQSFGSITNGLQRIRELALQASNGTLSDSDRQAINSEAQQFMSEITRTVDTSNFNGQSLLKNDSDIALQVGSEEGSAVNVKMSDFNQVLSDAGFSNVDLSTSAGASAALSVLDSVQSAVDSSSANIGASINRLDSTINALGNSEINAAESRSRIRDADMAKEISNLVQNQLKRDASIAIQTQANQQSKSILKLLE